MYLCNFYIQGVLAYHGFIYHGFCTKVSIPRLIWPNSHITYFFPKGKFSKISFLMKETFDRRNFVNKTERTKRTFSWKNGSKSKEKETDIVHFNSIHLRSHCVQLSCISSLICGFFLATKCLLKAGFKCKMAKSSKILICS